MFTFLGSFPGSSEPCDSVLMVRPHGWERSGVVLFSVEPASCAGSPCGWAMLVRAAGGFLLRAVWKHRSHRVDVIRAIVLAWLDLGPSGEPVGIQMENEER